VRPKPKNRQTRAPRMQVGMRFTREARLPERSVMAFAKRAGDLNPLHHDRSYARRSRFKGLIASGTQTASLMMGLIASESARFALSLGLDFRFQFLAAARPGDRLTIEWRVTAVTPKRSLHGDLVNLVGSVRDASGRPLLASRAKILASARP
jgi:acyl dehydratase